MRIRKTANPIDADQRKRLEGYGCHVEMHVALEQALAKNKPAAWPWSWGLLTSYRTFVMCRFDTMEYYEIIGKQSSEDLNEEEARRNAEYWANRGGE